MSLCAYDSLRASLLLVPRDVTSPWMYYEWKRSFLLCFSSPLWRLNGKWERVQTMFPLSEHWDCAAQYDVVYQSSRKEFILLASMHSLCLMWVSTCWEGIFTSTTTWEQWFYAQIITVGYINAEAYYPNVSVVCLMLLYLNRETPWVCNVHNHTGEWTVQRDTDTYIYCIYSYGWAMQPNDMHNYLTMK